MRVITARRCSLLFGLFNKILSNSSNTQFDVDGGRAPPQKWHIIHFLGRDVVKSSVDIKIDGTAILVRTAAKNLELHQELLVML